MPPILVVAAPGTSIVVKVSWAHAKGTHRNRRNTANIDLRGYLIKQSPRLGLRGEPRRLRRIVARSGTRVNVQVSAHRACRRKSRTCPSVAPSAELPYVAAHSEY